MLATRTPENAFFFEKFYRGHDLPHPPAFPVYPAGGPHPIQRTRVDRTDGRRLRAGSVSETVQIWTHSNMNNFQHKNVCKTIDSNTRMC